MSYRGYFRVRKESRIFHMRHKGSLMVEADEIVFFGKGADIKIKYNELESVKLLKARSGIEFETKDGIVYIYTSLGDAGKSANARSIGNSLFGLQGGNTMSSIATMRATKRINEEIYKIINSRINKDNSNQRSEAIKILKEIREEEEFDEALDKLHK